MISEGLFSGAFSGSSSGFSIGILPNVLPKEPFLEKNREIGAIFEEQKKMALAPP
jgi:hypothetical protein